MPSINTILPLALLLGAFTASAAPLNPQCVILGVVVADPAADLQALQTANAACPNPPPQLAYLENQLRQCIVLQGGTPPTVPAGNVANTGTNNVAPAANFFDPAAGPGISAIVPVLGLRRRSFIKVMDGVRKLTKSGGK